MSLESQYKFLIKYAVKVGDHKKAQELREWAFLNFDLPLLEYCLQTDKEEAQVTGH